MPTIKVYYGIGSPVFMPFTPTTILSPADPHGPAPVRPDEVRLAILESIFGAITDSLLVLDSKLCVVDANQAFLARLGRSWEQVLGTAWASLFPHLAGMGRVQDLQAALAHGRPHRGRMPLLNAADGEALLFDVATYPLRDPQTGQVTHLVEYAHEVSEEVKLQLQILDANSELLSAQTKLQEKTSEVDHANRLLQEKCATLEEMNERLERLAVMDAMTDLPNHRAFQERLAQQVRLAARHKHPFSLILFDVDNFKQYNDRFGHPQGDLLLAQLARLFREAVRATDLPARYGGEEFALLLPETDKYAAALVAERLRVSVAQHVFPNRQVTISIGIAEFACDASDASGLVTCADKAMYHAKSSGKNTVSLWSTRSGRPVVVDDGTPEWRREKAASLPAGCRSVPTLPAHLRSGSASGRSLLLIDPDELSRSTVRESLMGEGYAVAVAQSGREALSLLADAQASFDMIVSETMLPDKTGQDVQQEARVLCPQVPFLFFASQAGDTAPLQAALPPESLLLVKPFALYELLSLIEQTLAAPRAAQSLAA